ncbi:MAG: response regulator, partial [Planctomycetota bacterium]
MGSDEPRPDPPKERDAAGGAAEDAGGAGSTRATSARASDITRLRAARSGLHRHAGSVLVADDDASTRRMLEVALGRKGYAVRVASGGEEAIGLLRERPFDVLLADIHMPDCDGLTLCEVARAMRPGMRLVLMTGFQTEESVLRAFRVGVSAYLRKPVRLPKLFRALARAARSPQGGPGTGGVGLERGRLSGEAEAILASPELVKSGIAFEPEGWISFEAPSHRVFLERFSNLSELLLTRVVDADT